MGGSILEALQIEIIVSLIVGVGSFVFLNLLQIIWRGYRASRGPLTGYWVQRIYDDFDPKKLIKIDVVRCRNIGEIVIANINRVFPEKQTGRSWKFSGTFRGPELFGDFKTTDIKDPSWGTIYLRQEKKDKFRGTYTKTKMIPEDFLTHRLEIPSILLEWEYHGKRYPKNVGMSSKN